MSGNQQTGAWADRAVNAIRTSTIVSAVVGIVLGLILLFWPGATLLVLALLFGIALIVAGLHRIVFGATVHLRTSFRWLMAILGALMVIAGVLCFIRPVATLVFVAIMIGVAWIFEGIHDIVAGFAGTTLGPRWVAFVGGLIGILAGIAVLTLPGLALSTFTVVGGILLIVISIVALCTLPRKVAAP